MSPLIINLVSLGTFSNLLGTFLDKWYDKWALIGQSLYFYLNWNYIEIEAGFECLNERHHNFWMKFSISDHSDTDYREIINSCCPHTLCALLSGKSVRTPQLLQWKTFFGVTAYITKNCSIEDTAPALL